MVDFWLKGPKHRIYFISEGGHETPRELAGRIRAQGPLAARLRGINRLRGKKLHPKSWKKLLAVITRTIEHGIEITSRNPARCKRFYDDDSSTCNEGSIEFCEFKADDLRVMFFVEEPSQNEPCKTLIVTHCFSKKRDDTPPKEKKRFCRLRCAYYRWRESLGASDAVHAYAITEQ